MALNIPKLQYNLPMTLDTGVPTQTFQRWWQEVADNITSNFNDLAQAVSDIQTLQTQMNARIAEISTLQTQMNDRITEIEAVQAAADAVTRDNSISASWVSGLTLSASDAGTNASITISDHTRFYDDTTSLAITGATLTALAYSTEYHIYYDDPTRADTTPTFLTSTTAATAAANRDVGRHYVGSITTPAAGGGSTSGSGSEPPGWRGTGTL